MKRRAIRHARALGEDRRGVAALEFALVGPVLLLLLLGTISVCLVLNNYIELTWGTGAAAQALASSRATTATPYTSSKSVLTSSVPGLNTSSLTIIMKVAGTACATDTACQTALSTAVGSPASVSVSYPCSLVIMGFDFAPGCTLTSQTTEIVQ